MTTVPTAGDEERLVERDLYEVANQLQGYVDPGTPDNLAAFLLREGAEAAKLADEIVRLRSEVSRCHERLEIDHYWKIGDNDDSDLERVEIPMDERVGMPDGISARDATIALMQEDNARLRQERDEARLNAAIIEGVSNELDIALTASNAEAERLREIVSQCAEAVGNGAFVSPSASVDFMAGLPEEIRLAASRLKEALTEARAYVLQAVNDDGGIENCEIGDRLALERIDAALQGSAKQ